MTIQEKATKIIAETQLITVASIDANGFPRPVVMVKLGEKDDVENCEGVNLKYKS